VNSEVGKKIDEDIDYIGKREKSLQTGRQILQ